MIVDIILDRDKLEEYFFRIKLRNRRHSHLMCFHPHVPRKERCLCSFHLDIMTYELP